MNASGPPGEKSTPRDKPWIFRTYAGHSDAAESNRLYRNNLAKGQTGLSVAFDLPTQTGYDPDHVLSRGEVGKVGVPVSHLGDMRTLFDQLPLAQMNTSMTINATAAWLLSLYIAVADEQGADRKALQGTTQNDLVKEYLSRGTYVFPPRPSMALTTDIVVFTARELPKWNPTNVCSYHLQEAGASPVQELSFALATAIALLDSIRARPEVSAEQFPEVVGRISFFVNAGMRFVTELCKMRAFVDLWDEITLGRYGVADEQMRRFRYGVQVNSLGLTEPQAENNVYRILIEMLAVTLSRKARARAVQLPAWNEALGLPRPFDQQWSLRMQQVLAYETDLLEFGDIFDGSAVIDAKVAELKAAALEELAKIDDRLHEAGAGRERRAPDRGDRAGRADRRRRQQVHQQRALSALGRGGQGRDRAGLRRARGDRPSQGLALGPRREGGRSCAGRVGLGCEGGAKCHAGLDRLRQGRRHHR
jgi:(2R)-ethylmalonyl-CoA mutase